MSKERNISKEDSKKIVGGTYQTNTEYTQEQLMIIAATYGDAVAAVCHEYGLQSSECSTCKAYGGTHWRCKCAVNPSLPECVTVQNGM